MGFSLFSFSNFTLDLNGFHLKKLKIIQYDFWAVVSEVKMPCSCYFKANWRWFKVVFVNKIIVLVLVIKAHCLACYSFLLTCTTSDFSVMGNKTSKDILIILCVLHSWRISCMLLKILQPVSERQICPTLSAVSFAIKELTHSFILATYKVIEIIHKGACKDVLGRED